MKRFLESIGKGEAACTMIGHFFAAPKPPSGQGEPEIGLMGTICLSTCGWNFYVVTWKCQCFWSIGK
eukprot:2050446-Amphidinium_carterae.1